MMSFRKDVYPFTTENIVGYIGDMDLKDKSLLTLGSSMDQAYNALLLGASDVNVFDINVNVELFHKIKSDLVLNVPREQLYHSVIGSYFIKNRENITDYNSFYKYNLYMQSDDNYNLLRKKLLEDRIRFINGNIFDIKDELDNKKYDRMILSNVLQYLELYSIDKDKYEVLKTTFKKLKNHLNDDGIIQLLYLYNTKLINNYRSDDYFDGYNLTSILNSLYDDINDITGFSLLEFENGYSNYDDGVVFYKKRGR